MTDKTLDLLPNSPSIAGKNLLHMKKDFLTGDGVDYHIEFEDFVQSVVDILSTDGSVAADDYIIIQDDASGNTYKITANNLMEDLHALVASDTASMVGTDKLVFGDVSDTAGGHAGGTLKSTTVTDTVAVGAKNQPVHYADVLGASIATTEVVCILNGVTKRIKLANLSHSIGNGLAEVVSGFEAADFILFEDISDNVTKKAKHAYLCNTTIKNASAINTGFSYDPTTSILIDPTNMGNAQATTVKSFMQKAPWLVDTDSSVNRATDFVMYYDNDAQLSKKATINDIFAPNKATANDAIQATGTGTLNADILSGLAGLYSDTNSMCPVIPSITITGTTNSGAVYTRTASCRLHVFRFGGLLVQAVTLMFSGTIGVKYTVNIPHVAVPTYGAAHAGILPYSTAVGDYTVFATPICYNSSSGIKMEAGVCIEDLTVANTTILRTTGTPAAAIWGLNLLFIGRNTSI